MREHAIPAFIIMGVWCMAWAWLGWQGFVVAVVMHVLTFVITRIKDPKL